MAGQVVVFAPTRRQPATVLAAIKDKPPSAVASRSLMASARDGRLATGRDIEAGSPVEPRNMPVFPSKMFLCSIKRACSSAST
jgi:hypothetical protein